MRLQARLDEEEFGVGVDVATPSNASDTPTNAATTSQSDAKTVENVANNESSVEEKETNVESPLKVNPPSASLEDEKEESKDEKDVELTKVEENGTFVIDRKGTTVTQVQEGEAKEKKAIVSFTTTNTRESLSSDDLKAKRAARFGIPIHNGGTKKNTSGKTKSISFEEKKLKRAARFGIEVKDKKASVNDQQKDKKRKGKKQGGGGEVNAKKQKSNNTAPTLSKEEIMKRLERAEKYGSADINQVDQLKAMLRLHRFGGN